jgi:hypothetical protein
MQNLIERVLKKIKPKPPRNIFDMHHEHHRKVLVDTTSFQAKRLGLTYLGFGRYGKMSMPAASPNNNKAKPSVPEGQYQVTHIVRNGLLVQTPVAPPENNYYPAPDQRSIHSYLEKQAKRVREQLEASKGRQKTFLTKAIDTMKDFTASGYVTINRVLMTNMLSKAHPSIIHKITTLDKLYKNPITQLDSNLTVYASTSAPMKKGKVFQFKGFMSTCVCPKTAAGFEGGASADVDIHPPVDLDDNGKPSKQLPTLLQIDLKKGQRALDYTSLTGGRLYQPKDAEDEFILPRDSHIHIVDGPIYLKHAIVWRAEVDQEDEDFTDPPTK